MVVIDNKEYRNLQEQVLKNMDDIKFILEEEGVLNQFGLKVVYETTPSTTAPADPTVGDLWVELSATTPVVYTPHFYTSEGWTSTATAGIEYYKATHATDPGKWGYGDTIACKINTNPVEHYMLTLTRKNDGHANDYWFNIGIFPRKGDKGDKGDTGTFNSVTASVDSNVGTPTVTVTYSQADVDFAFHNLKGQKGDDGDPGETGRRGSIWTVGGPLPEEALLNDQYLAMNGDVYEYGNSGWATSGVNIRGPQGPATEPNVFIAIYGVTSLNDIAAAHTANKALLCKTAGGLMSLQTYDDSLTSFTFSKTSVTSTNSAVTDIRTVTASGWSMTSQATSDTNQTIHVDDRTFGENASVDFAAGNGISLNVDTSVPRITISSADHYSFETMGASSGTMTAEQLAGLQNDNLSYVLHNTGDILIKVDENSNFIMYSNSRESSSNIHHYTFKVMKSDRTWTLASTSDKIITNVSGALSYDSDTKTLSADHSNLVTTNTNQTITGTKEFTSLIKMTNSGFYDTSIVNNAYPNLTFRPVSSTYESILRFPVPAVNTVKVLATTDDVNTEKTRAQGVETSLQTSINSKSTVSGANDGTNWTSITINGVNRSIPQGGGGSTTIYVHHICVEVDDGPGGWHTVYFNHINKSATPLTSDSALYSAMGGTRVSATGCYGEGYSIFSALCSSEPGMYVLSVEMNDQGSGSTSADFNLSGATITDTVQTV